MPCLLPGLRDATQRQHAAVRAAQGHRRGWTTRGVLRGLQRHGAAAAPGRLPRRFATHRRRHPRRPNATARAGALVAHRPAAIIARTWIGPSAWEQATTACSARRSCGATCPIFSRLAGGLPEFAGLDLHTLLTRVFDDPRYVWVTRKDKVRQAVSLWRALQTRAWRREQASPDGCYGPRYSFAGIEHLTRSLQAEDQAWQSFFADQGIKALKIAYQADLERNQNAAVRAVLGHIGVHAPRGWRPAEVLRAPGRRLV